MEGHAREIRQEILGLQARIDFLKAKAAREELIRSGKECGCPVFVKYLADVVCPTSIGKGDPVVRQSEEATSSIRPEVLYLVKCPRCGNEINLRGYKEFRKDPKVYLSVILTGDAICFPCEACETGFLARLVGSWVVESRG